MDYASRVRGLAKFVKCAYPDMVGAESPPKETAELLLEKNRRNYRSVSTYDHVYLTRFNKPSPSINRQLKTGRKILTAKF